MGADVPDWADVWGRTWCAGCATARGVLRLDPRASGGGGVETSFLFAFPNRWRIADAGGAAVWIDDGEQEWTRGGPDEPMRHRRHGQQGTPTYGPGHPGAMLGESPWVHATRYAYGAPAAPGRAVTVAGRLCWEFALEPHAEDPVDPDGPGVWAPPPAMTVAFDDATGIALRLDLAGAELAELVEFEPDVDVPDDAFQWDGPAAPRSRWSEEEVEAAAAAGIVLVEEITARPRTPPGFAIPTPRWWPSGLPGDAGLADPATGAYSVMLEVAGWPVLARWPLGGEPPRQFPPRDGDHQRLWTRDGWQWALSVREPLPDDELERVVASIEFPPGEPT